MSKIYRTEEVSVVAKVEEAEHRIRDAIIKETVKLWCRLFDSVRVKEVIKEALEEDG